MTWIWQFGGGRSWNGWQSLYAPRTIGVCIGQSVYQGDVIAGWATKADPQDLIFSFELRFKVLNVNPGWNVYSNAREHSEGLC
jgi:hypothetical protein